MTLLHHPTAADAALLDALTAPNTKSAFARRDAALDPLLIAAATASGPHVTRNHYHHDFFPGVMLPQAEGAWDWSKFTGEDASSKSAKKRLTYVSRQAPRRQRLGIANDSKENDHPRDNDVLKSTDNLPSISKKRRPSLPSLARPITSQVPLKLLSESTPPPLHVKCMARTRIPTPHGPAFLHLYHNNRDNKEHLAIVVDPVQLSESSDFGFPVPHIRSRSLDAVWDDSETEMERLTRGAYVGRLSSTSQCPSSPLPLTNSPNISIPPPLVRIHSECFTGETIGSMRCDCGEQLDEAIRQISQPVILHDLYPYTQRKTIPGRGAVIYLRQEGRGIGLLSKIRAYNLQDMGHDTVTANLMLGHKPDERGYEVAGAILHDLGLGSRLSNSEAGGVRLLTNNPDKVEALEKEGIQVVERLPMIPRSWQRRKAENDAKKNDTVVIHEEETLAGATLIGGKAVHGDDLDKYLRTKILRMGHILPMWMDNPDISIY